MKGKRVLGAIPWVLAATGAASLIAAAYFVRHSSNVGLLYSILGAACILLALVWVIAQKEDDDVGRHS